MIQTGSQRIFESTGTLGIVEPVPIGGNYIGGPGYLADEIYPFLKEIMDICARIAFCAALEREAAILTNCTPLDAAELWVILARLDAAEDEKIRGELDRELHKKIAKIADNPMVLQCPCGKQSAYWRILFPDERLHYEKNNSVRG